jgi:hypothetical protein
MKLGCSNPDAIRHIGRDQASYIIDRIKEDYSEMFARAKNRTQTIAAMVVLGIVLAIALFWLLSTYL